MAQICIICFDEYSLPVHQTCCSCAQTPKTLDFSHSWVWATTDMFWRQPKMHLIGTPPGLLQTLRISPSHTKSAYNGPISNAPQLNELRWNEEPITVSWARQEQDEHHCNTGCSHSEATRLIQNTLGAKENSWSQCHPPLCTARLIHLVQPIPNKVNIYGWCVGLSALYTNSVSAQYFTVCICHRNNPVFTNIPILQMGNWGPEMKTVQ